MTKEEYEALPRDIKEMIPLLLPLSKDKLKQIEVFAKDIQKTNSKKKSVYEKRGLRSL